MEHELAGLQGEIYKVILAYAREHGRPPTNREIGRAVNVESTGHIDYHLTVPYKKPCERAHETRGLTASIRPCYTVERGFYTGVIAKR